MSTNSDILSHNESTDAPRDQINLGQIERLASAIAGGALAFYGLRRRTLPGMGLTVAGAALLHRGVTGHCNGYEALGISTNTPGKDSAAVAKDVHVEKSILIDKSPEELYTFWRSFENLPHFMKHLESVSCAGLNRSHWVAQGPTGNVEWDAEIYNDKPNELIAWRSLPGSDITNAGSVRFTPLGSRGTEVKVVLNYNAPGGKLSALMAKLFGREPGQMIADDLRRLKQILETGEVATTEGQPSARDPQAKPFQAASTTSDEPETEPQKSRAASARG